MSCFAFETAFSSRWTLFSISVIPSITASYSPPSAGVVSMVNPLYSIFISISNSYPGVLPAWKVPLPVISGRPGSSSNRFRGSAAFFRILAWHAFSGLRSFVRKLSDLRRQGDKPRFLAIVPHHQLCSRIATRDQTSFGLPSSVLSNSRPLPSLSANSLENRNIELRDKPRFVGHILNWDKRGFVSEK